MANIAQVANVLQSMVLTRGAEMVLTPTYYVFRMYAPHMGAIHVPLSVETPVEEMGGGRKTALVHATASQKDGKTTISLTNVSLSRDADLEITTGLKGARISDAEILTSSAINDYNDFGVPEKVSPKKFREAKLKGDTLRLRLPARSIVCITLE